MIARNLAYCGQRSSLKAELGLLLGHRLVDGSDWIWPLADAFGNAPRIPRLLIVDVVTLLSSEATFLPRLTPASPDILVIGSRQDDEALISAWNEGIPALLIARIDREMVTQMLSPSRQESAFYHYLGQYGAERVHGFLTRKFEKKTLTERERAIAELIRLGWTFARIASHLGIGAQTAKNHAGIIYEKLGVSGRYELAARYGGPAVRSAGRHTGDAW